MTPPDSPTLAVDGLDAARLLAGTLSPVSSPAFAWTPPSVAEVAPWFPDYEIRALAGRGAMGAVYRAVQRKLERPVAIKLLPAELAAREGVATRFEREARAMAQLSHPGIVALHDYGRTDGGHLFIVMEYVDGTDLSRLIHAEGGGLSVPQALEIVGQVCDALQYAHSCGFVHRDIKPGNVLVDKDGRVKIADFGLAKLLGESGSGRWPEQGAGQRPAPHSSRLTLTGQALGTPDYTAPEQLKGGPVDHRADIYSLGVMFYEMLTGDLPRGTWTPPSQLTAAPARLDEVVTRAMRTEPDHRYQQASEVKSAIAEAKMLPPVVAAATPRTLPAGRLINRTIGTLLFVAAFWTLRIHPNMDLVTGVTLWVPCVLLGLWFCLWSRRMPLSGGLLAGAALAWVSLYNYVTTSGYFYSRSVLEVQGLLKNGRLTGDSESRRETIAPAQDGRLLEIKVNAGQQIAPGSIVAVMDQSRLKVDLLGLKEEVLERWVKEMDGAQREILNLEPEIRQLQTAYAEDAAIIKQLEALLAQGMGNADERGAKLELAKAKSRTSLQVQHMSQIEESLRRLRAKAESPAKSAATLNPVEMSDERVVPLLPLTAAESQRRRALLQSLSDCELRTVLGGVVEQISKTAGEHCAADEVILTITPVKAIE